MYVCPRVDSSFYRHLYAGTCMRVYTHRRIVTVFTIVHMCVCIMVNMYALNGEGWCSVFTYHIHKTREQRHVQRRTTTMRILWLFGFACAMQPYTSVHTPFAWWCTHVHIHTACTTYTRKHCVIHTKTPPHTPPACKHDTQLHITLYLRACGVRAGVASHVYVVPSHVYVLLSNVKAFFFRIRCMRFI